MKKLTVWLMVLSLGLFTIGCGETADDAGTTPAAPEGGTTPETPPAGDTGEAPTDEAAVEPEAPEEAPAE